MWVFTGTVSLSTGHSSSESTKLSWVTAFQAEGEPIFIFCLTASPPGPQQVPVAKPAFIPKRKSVFPPTPAEWDPEHVSVPPRGKGPSLSWSNSKMPPFGLETCSFQTKPSPSWGPPPSHVRWPRAVPSSGAVPPAYNRPKAVNARHPADEHHSGMARLHFTRWGASAT